MKSRRAILLLSILCCLLVFSGCQCEHEWTYATCLTAKTCARCGETEGEPLGHSWTDATCTAPKTCAACGVTEGTVLEHSWTDATCEDPKTCTACGGTEGEALGHSFGQWDFGTEDMTRTCTVCSGTETTEIDREIWLRHILEGSWDLAAEITDGSVTFMQGGSGFMAVALRFYGDNQGYLYTTSEAQPFTWELMEVDDSSDPNSLYAKLTPGDQSAPMIILVDASQKSLSLFTSQTQRLLFMQRPLLTQALTGLWAGIHYGIETLKLSADRTFTGSFTHYNLDPRAIVNEDISGIWYVSPEYSYGGLVFCDLYLCTSEDGNTKQYMAAVYLTDQESYSADSLLHGELKLFLDMDGSSHSFDGLDDEAYAELEHTVLDSICGPWTSSKIQYYGDGSFRETDAYSINFAEDGTFTAVLDTERTGTWTLELVDKDDRGATNRYVYRLIFDGIDDYFLFTTNNDGDTYLQFYRRNCGIYFLQMTEEKIAEREAIRKETTERLVGPWTSIEIYYYGDGYSDGSFRVTDAYSFNFAEDGTFTAVLDTEITGTWAFKAVETNADGTVYGYEYSLTFDGIKKNTSSYISFFIHTDGDASFMAHNLDYEISFLQMTEEKIAERNAARAEAAERVAGTWTSFCRAHADGQDNWRGYSITFAEDGTFTAVLDQEYSGTWEYGYEHGVDSITMHEYELRFDDISVREFVTLRIHDSSWQTEHPGNKELGIAYQDENGKYYTIWFELSGK